MSGLNVKPSLPGEGMGEGCMGVLHGLESVYTHVTLVLHKIVFALAYFYLIFHLTKSLFSAIHETIATQSVKAY